MNTNHIDKSNDDAIIKSAIKILESRIPCNSGSPSLTSPEASKQYVKLQLAEYEHEPLAALMAFRQGTHAYYFYGASAGRHRNLMPAYLLQWEAIRWAKSYECTLYDLWGVPDQTLETLEANFLESSDDLWGVYRFKRGFGGSLKRVVRAMDRVYKPILYKLYLYRLGNLGIK